MHHACFPFSHEIQQFCSTPGLLPGEAMVMKIQFYPEQLSFLFF